MAKNILSELALGFREIIDNGERQYRKVTQESFLEVVSYVRDGTWCRNETERFVASHFACSQKEMADIWNESHEQKKADSTFRVQAQNINEYLGSVFPSDWLERFISEDSEKINDMLKVIDSLRLNDRKIEVELGEKLMDQLRKYPLTCNQYKAEECLNELRVLKTLSETNTKELLESCDEDKLSYVVQALTYNIGKRDKVNQQRMSLLHEYTKVDPNQSITQRAFYDYAEGAKVSEDTILNLELLKFFAIYCTYNGVLNSLSKFPKEDVAYLLKKLESKDRDVLTYIKSVCKK